MSVFFDGKFILPFLDILNLKRYDQFLVIAFNSVPLIYVSTKYSFTIFLGDIKCIEEKRDTLKFRKNVLVDYYH